MNDTTNVTELFGTKDEAEAEPNFRYTVTFRDGTTAVSEGYFVVVTSNMVGVAQGSKGILADVWPLEQVKAVHNEGPVAISSATLN